MRDTIDNCVLMYAIFDNLTRSKIQLGSHAKIAGCLRALLKDGKFCLQTCFFLHKWLCKKFKALHHLLPGKKIHVKNVKKYRKYFQIEQDEFIFCKKISVNLLNIVFQCNANWRWKFPTS